MPPVAAPVFACQPGFAPAVPAEQAPFRGGGNGAPLCSGTVPFNWIIRSGGSNNNGGSDSSLTALRTGTDGVTTSGSTTMTSATANFTSADINRGICIATGTNARRHKIIAVTNSTTVTLDRAVTATLSGQTWAIGGAWADIRAAMGMTGPQGASADGGSPVAAGDIVWFGAGIYYISSSGSNLIFGSGWTSQPVTFRGDVFGQKTGDSGMVMITAQIANATGLWSGTLLDLGATSLSISNLTFERIFFMSGNGGSAIFTASNANNFSSNLTFRDCSFANSHGGSGATIPIETNVGPSHRGNWTFDRCRWIFAQGAGQGNVKITSLLAPYDWDLGWTFKNCLITSPFNANGSVAANGAFTGKPGGIRVISSSCCGGGLLSVGSNFSTNVPSYVYSSACFAAATPFTATTLGSYIEDWNYVTDNTVRTNVPVGPHTTGSPNSLFLSYNQETQWGGQLRPYMEPLQNSGSRRYGAYDTSAGAYDLLGRPRPSIAAAYDSGAIQRWNTGVKNISVTNSGSSSLQFTGFGGQDIYLPVDAETVRLNAYMRYDSNYQGPLPRLEVVGGDEIGVGEYHLPISSQSLNAFKLYTITINPTAKGYVTVRFSCLDTSGVGNLYVDDFYVS